MSFALRHLRETPRVLRFPWLAPPTSPLRSMGRLGAFFRLLHRRRLQTLQRVGPSPRSIRTSYRPLVAGRQSERLSSWLCGLGTGKAGASDRRDHIIWGWLRVEIRVTAFRSEGNVAARPSAEGDVNVEGSIAFPIHTGGEPTPERAAPSNFQHFSALPQFSRRFERQISLTVSRRQHVKFAVDREAGVAIKPHLGCQSWH